MKRMKNGMLMGAIVLSGLLAIAVPSASADSFSFTSCNPGAGGLCDSASPGPYGTLSTSLVDGNEIRVTVVAASGFAFFGNGGMLGFDVVGSTAGLAINDLTSSAGVGAASLVGPLSLNGQMDGYGTFEGVVDGPQASLNLTSFSFDVTRTGGFSSASQLTELSSTPCGNGCTVFAAHVRDTTGAFLGGTGFSDATAVVPEPTSLLLAGSALVGLGYYARRKRWMKSLAKAA